ncbi:MAG: glycine cleavage system protein GcvH [Candidatus Eremiobacteraeota bacterium]|nr:glycine cleavage system protein GcvH [Candidatus Eremiobacteraeota bacterium]
MVPDDLKYTREHEWVRIEGDLAIIGITHHAQEMLGDIVFIELPEIGEQVEQMGKIGTIESVKTVSDLYSPLSGTIKEVNNVYMDRIEGRENPDFHPEYANQDPYGNGWIAKLVPSDPGEMDNLLSPEDYKKLLEEEA